MQTTAVVSIHLRINVSTCQQAVMLKKSSILLSYGGIPCSHLPPAAFHKLPRPSQTLPTRRAHQPQHPQSRTYALISSGHSRHQHGGLRWPEVSRADAVPSPYQIFNQKKGSPYSKHRFYELVKMYHPDRHSQEDSIASDLPYATKLERYRLVVAANDILSDPIKRGAYDLYGAGWNGQPDVGGPRDSGDPSTRDWQSYAGRGWGHKPKGPSQNATWEDWERWYQTDAKGSQGSQSPISNGAFVGLLVLFAALGVIGQLTHGGQYSLSFVDQQHALHNEMSQDLIRRRREAIAFDGDKQERIHSFLKQRDPYGYGIADPREETYRKMLPAPEVSSSDNIKGRSLEVHSKDRPRN